MDYYAVPKGEDYICHRSHKYISRVWKNGKWNYIYANVKTAGNNVKTAGNNIQTIANNTKNYKSNEEAYAAEKKNANAAYNDTKLYRNASKRYSQMARSNEQATIAAAKRGDIETQISQDTEGLSNGLKASVLKQAEEKRRKDMIVSNNNAKKYKNAMDNSVQGKTKSAANKVSSSAAVKKAKKKTKVTVDSLKKYFSR